MTCEHDLVERETAATADAMCPLCMAAEIERLRAGSRSRTGATNAARYWAKGGRQMSNAEIRPNPGAKVDDAGRCEDTDEVLGSGFLHVEQVGKGCYWARLDLPDGKAIVMRFSSKSPITLTAEWD